MSQIKIFLPISQLAIIVGLSKYGSLTQIILKLWIKIDFEGYSKKIIQLEQKYNKSFGLINDWDKMQLLANELGLHNLTDKTKMTMKNKNNIDLQINQTAILHDIEHITQNNNNLSQIEIDNKKQILSKLVNNITNCAYGQYNEDSAINIYSSMTNSIISDQQKKIIAFIKITQINTKTIEWNLIGKIDGLATNQEGNTILIEIKNRTRVLFNHLKDYEKPQIQAYMKLTGFKHAHLVEHITNDTNIIPVEYDSKYWKLIRTRLHQFIDFFINFVNNEKLQELILLDGQYNDMLDIHFRQLLESYF
jgi:hypothetical protein